MTFKDYLVGLKPGHDAKGDFVRLARADAEMPEVATVEDLTAYVERRGSYMAVEAGREVWADYQAKQRENARSARTA